MRWRPVLRGRRGECEALDRQLRGIAGGQSSVLVLRGEAGVGKSALLEYVAERASGCRVVRAVGVQSEMELAFAGLHQLCAGMLDRIAGLPGPQRDALQAAFGLQEGGNPDHFAVAVAVLSLLSEAAETEPLVCLIDDAQWLDRASSQALAFVSRRLLAERIAMVFAVREPVDVPDLAGLPELVIEGLPDSEARLLLASGIPGRLDERVRDRIVAETRGNPLALLELPRGMTPADLAGGFGLPGTGSLAGRIEQVFADRVDSLPPDSRELLLLAAAEPLGDVTLLWRAAEHLGIKPAAAEPAEAAGLVEFGARVQFRHPLVRSAAYRTAAPHDRQEAHRALAEATDADADPDRRAWHRAQATVGLDETVATELERSAVRAQRRGGAAAAAAFLQRAAVLTPDPARRAERALAGARAKIEVADPDAASELLGMADLCPLDDYQRARARRLRAQVAFSRSRGSDALPLLLDAAKGLAAFNTDLTRDTYLEAFAAAIYAGEFGHQDEVKRVAAAALSGPVKPGDAIAALVRGLATVFIDGYPAAVPPLRKALDVFRHADENADDINRWQWLACRIAFDLWDKELSAELSGRGLRLARETGALGILPIAANFRAGTHVHAGEFAAASVLMEEAAAITEATGTAPLVYTLPMLAAYRGEEAETMSLLDVARRDAVDRGQGLALSMIGCAQAVLLNGLARYEEAVAAAEPASRPAGLGVYALSLVELIEAAVRSGRPELAASALDRLAERTGASSTDWARGLEARSRALLAAGSAAESLYQEAIARLASGNVTLYLARARLVYGEWLRRENRRVDARRQLSAAHDLFDGFGARAFAERARRELLATGETARRRSPDALSLLTPQEAQIARLAGAGLTNPEIGAQLFISPRTVEYHLRKVFPKLDISSRKDLRPALAGARAQLTRDAD
ncbi:MAG TPA: AAA family ATPase [Mycobacteriales bacterium]|nr:AAA family ATPase [Mycobacteriales bacterium]